MSQLFENPSLFFFLLFLFVLFFFLFIQISHAFNSFIDKSSFSIYDIFKPNPSIQCPAGCFQGTCKEIRTPQKINNCVNDRHCQLCQDASTSLLYADPFDSLLS